VPLCGEITKVARPPAERELPMGDPYAAGEDGRLESELAVGGLATALAGGAIGVVGKVDGRGTDHSWTKPQAIQLL